MEKYLFVINIEERGSCAILTGQGLSKQEAWLDAATDYSNEEPEGEPKKLNSNTQVFLDEIMAIVRVYPDGGTEELHGDSMLEDLEDIDYPEDDEGEDDDSL
jgi:hypothetical protein